MSKSSCIRHPESNRYIQLHEWQVNFCQNNHCAALLLAFFTAWHDWKIKNDQYYHRANDIAEMHGDGRPNNENAYLFFSTEQLIEGCMGFYGKNAVNEALQFLVSLEVISIHKNPNPRYHFDKTKYFLFHPIICNQWIAEKYPIKEKAKLDTQLVDFSDTPKEADRYSENSQRLTGKGRPSIEKGRYITNTTNNTTNKDQSIKVRKDFIEQIKKTDDENTDINMQEQAVLDALIQQGFSEKHFDYPDTIETINRLCNAGATVDVFLEAYEISAKTSSRGFGVNYLAKVVEDLLAKKRKKDVASRPESQSDNNKPNYEADYSKSLHWMGDLV